MTKQEGEHPSFQDLDRLNRKLHDLNALITTGCGFTYIDETKAGHLVDIYRGLIQYGYANGII